MIASLKGTLLSKRPGGTIVEVNGVGYNVYLSLNTLSQLPEEGSTIFLYIYTYVREDTIQLYGFSKEEEKKIFITLIGISGIGPKVALSILSSMPSEQFLEAIESENTGMLSRIPGIGKKTANRLILELKEKLPASLEKKNRTYDDVLSALINLGYKKSEAAHALDRTYSEEKEDVETLLKETLKYLTNE